MRKLCLVNLYGPAEIFGLSEENFFCPPAHLYWLNVVQCVLNIQILCWRSIAHHHTQQRGRYACRLLKSCDVIQSSVVGTTGCVWECVWYHLMTDTRIIFRHWVKQAHSASLWNHIRQIIWK